MVRRSVGTERDDISIEAMALAHRMNGSRTLERLGRETTIILREI